MQVSLYQQSMLPAARSTAISAELTMFGCASAGKVALYRTRAGNCIAFRAGANTKMSNVNGLTDLIVHILSGTAIERNERGV